MSTGDVITLLTKSSTNPDKPYVVTFLQEGDTLKILCTCPAGEFGQLCKHKLSLASNNPKMLFDVRQKDLLVQTHNLVKTSNLLSLIHELNLLEKAMEDTKKKLKAAKATTGRAMADGLKMGNRRD